MVPTGKEVQMQTLAKWTSILRKDFLELTSLDQQKPFARIRYSLKEQEIGQHCCQAEEMLPDPELASLKLVLGMDDEQWRNYRRKVRPCPEEPDETGRA